MTVLLSKSERLALGLNTLPRSITYGVNALWGLVRVVPALKDRVSVATVTVATDTAITATWSGKIILSFAPDAIGKFGFDLLESIEVLTVNPPDNPPIIDSQEVVEEIPDEPAEINTLEKFLYWSALILQNSTYPNTDYVKLTPEYKPTTGNPTITLEFNLPYDLRKFNLTQNLTESLIQFFDYHVTDPDQLPNTPWVIPPSSQFWRDPVPDLAALTALTGQPIGVNVPVLSVGSVFTLIAELPDGETLDGENFLEPDTQTATEVWSRAVGKTGPQGEPGTPGAGVTWHGPWDSGTAYVAQDAVEHLGSSWIANAPNTNKIPGTDPEWDLWVEKGQPGAEGEAGPAGNDGLTAYEVAVLNGFIGTEQAWLTSLRGEPGPPGTVSATSGVILDQVPTPSDPGTGKTAVYAKNDGQIYILPAGGVEMAIGSGGNSQFETPLVDKALYYYDSGSGLFKPVGIGTLDQVLVAKPSSNPPYQFATATSGGREVLTANRTYYIRTDGNDSNNGLLNTIGGAFATINRFFDELNKIDLSGFAVTGQIGDGVYAVTSSIQVKGDNGNGEITLQGNPTTPSNVTIQSVNNINLFQKTGIGTIEINGIKVQSTGSTPDFVCFNVSNGILKYKNIEFGATTTGSFSAGNNAHFYVTNRGGIMATGNSTITGDAGYHIFVFYDGIVLDDYLFNPGSPISSTLTLSGTRNFVYFVRLLGGEYRQAADRRTIIGSANGIRYSIGGRGICATGGGANYFPGNSPGTVDNTTYSYYS